MTCWCFEKASIWYFQLTPKAIASLDSTNPRAAGLMAALTPQKSCCLWIRKPWGWVAWRGRSLKTQEAWRGAPERSDPPPVWQEEAIELLAHRTEKVGAGYAVAGGDLGRGGKQNLLPSNFGDVAFVHLTKWFYPLHSLPPRRWSDQPSRGPRGGWWGWRGQGSSPPAWLPLGLQWSWCTPGTAFSLHTSGIFQLSTAPSENFWRALVCSTLPAPVTNKISKSFTSIKNVEQEQHFSHQMSNTSEADSTRSLWEFLSSIIYYYKLLTRSGLFRLLRLLH